MTNATATRIDPADVEIVQDLEPELGVFEAAIAKARPALERLMGAKYPGAGYVSDALLDILGHGASAGELGNIRIALEEFTVGDGDQAALDFYRFVQKDGLTVGKAAAQILDGDTDEAHLDRVDALRRYAAAR